LNLASRFNGWNEVASISRHVATLEPRAIASLINSRVATRRPHIFREFQPLKRLAKFKRRYATPAYFSRAFQPLKRLAKFKRRYATPAFFASSSR
jgi:hypothetical protein